MIVISFMMLVNYQTKNIYEEIEEYEICDKLDWFVQNDKQHTKKYSSLIKLRDKLSFIIMEMDKEVEEEE